MTGQRNLEKIALLRDECAGRGVTAEMWSTYYQMTVTQLIKDSLVKLCVEHVPCSGTLEIDGIVCIACGDDSKQLVVKVHQVLDVASQNESKHCNIVGGRVNAKVECHDQLGNDDSTDSINDDQTVDTVPIGQSGNDLVSAAPTTPIWKWPSSPPRCPVEQNPDIDTQNDDDDFPSSRIDDREFACERCGQSFHGVLRMQAHTAKVHSRYMCKHCLNTFSLRCNLRRHERLHAGLKPYSCDVCCKSFARSTDLKIHLARHSIVKCSAGSFTCSRCPNKTFGALSGLRWHMHKIHRQQDAVHQCSECGQVFFDRLTYQTHCRLHTDLLVVKPMGDRELLEEDAMDDRGDTGDSNSVSPCNNADPTVTDTSAGPAMVSILKMSVINGRLHRSKQKASGCGSYKDELPEKANDEERPHPEHASKPLSRSHPSCDNGVAVGNDTTNVNDTGRCTLTRLLVTAADASRSKRRKGGPVKHVMSSDVVSSDVSDSDASDISSGNTFPLTSLTSGTEAVDTPCHNMTLPFDSRVAVPVATSAILQPEAVVTPARRQPESVVTPARRQPESVVTPARLQPESVVTPARLQPESVVALARLQPQSVVTPAILQPVSVVTPARLQPESVVTPARLQPESVVTPARLQPESVVTPARLQPESVVTPARLQPESVVTPARLQPESVVTPARLQPESVVTPARLQPESVVTPARLQPELVVTPARLQPESVVTPARLQPELVVTSARLQPVSVVTPARLQPVDPDTAVSVLDAESCELATSAADTSASERKGYICSRFNCGKVFVGFSKYELHYTEMHDRYPCHFCDNSFTGKNNRIRHEKTHVGGKSYRCKDCMRMFSRPDSLREHQFTHTASYREQKCRICGATYDKKARLLSHMKKCFRGMRIVDYNTDSVEVRLPKRGRKEDDHSLLLDGFTA